MPYIYRYSREMLVSITGYCPICRKRLDWFRSDHLKLPNGLPSWLLSCSAEHERDYTKQMFKLNIHTGKILKQTFLNIPKTTIDTVIQHLIDSNNYNLTIEIEDNIPKFERK